MLFGVCTNEAAPAFTSTAGKNMQRLKNTAGKKHDALGHIISLTHTSSCTQTHTHLEKTTAIRILFAQFRFKVLFFFFIYNVLILNVLFI